MTELSGSLILIVVMFFVRVEYSRSRGRDLNVRSTEFAAFALDRGTGCQTNTFAVKPPTLNGYMRNYEGG